MRPDGLAKDLGERPGTDRIRDLSNRYITDHHRVAAELDAETVECTADFPLRPQMTAAVDDDRRSTGVAQRTWISGRDQPSALIPM